MGLTCHTGLCGWDPSGDFLGCFLGVVASILGGVFGWLGGLLGSRLSVLGVVVTVLLLRVSFWGACGRGFAFFYV